MQYKYELHCHTSQVSRCAHTSAQEAVRLYAQKGYNGIVITDHYSPMTFPLTRVWRPQTAAELYLRGYRAALAAAPAGFTVLLGMELRFYCTINDYLIYGMTEEFIRQSGNLLKLNPEKASELAHAQGMLFLQAHPFRAFMTRANPAVLDGTEGYNAKDAGTSANERAVEWAHENGLKILTSGSDFHKAGQNTSGGIVTDTPINTNDELLRVLRTGEYSFIV